MALERTGRQLGVRTNTRRRLVVGGQIAVFIGAMAIQLTSPFAAVASALVGATFSGGAGTAVVSGIQYAKSGSSLTLSVATDTTTQCVALSGASSATMTAPTAADVTSKTWQFALTAASGADGARNVTVTASNDPSCATADATTSRSYVVDNTAPTLTPTVTPTPNSFGWSNGDIMVTWAATDAGSGVASGPTPSSQAQTTETGGIVKSSSATDAVGNTRTASVTVRLDKTAPTVTGTKNPAANANGWNNTNVTVTFTCSDSRAGIRTCTGGTSTFTSNVANQILSGSALDFAGNTSSISVVVNVDKNAPTLSGAPVGSPNAAGWYNADVSVHWTCVDTGGSGFASGACADATISSEGTGLTVSESVTDLAGNSSATETSSPAVNLDKTPPSTTATASTGSGSSVTVSLSATDGLSGVKATQFTIDGGSVQTYDASNPPMFNSQGTHKLEYWSVDNADNAEKHQTYSTTIDSLPPTIAASQAPAPNSNGWNNSDVTVTFTCSDADSGVASCTPPVAVTTEGANQSVKGAALDNSGNSASTSATVSIDKTAPVASVNGVVAGGTYQQGSYTPSCSTSDALSGVATPASLSTSGGPTGSVTLTCSGAVDRAGNAQASPVSVQITVTGTTGGGGTGYHFGGFLPPVAGNGAVNQVRPGSVVPIRFNLGGYQGMRIFAAGYPQSGSAACGSMPAPSALQRVGWPWGVWLRYDRYSDTYGFYWFTSPWWTGCRTLVLTFSDGSTQVAYFDFEGHDWHGHDRNHDPRRR